jgi:hypothetical protein
MLISGPSSVASLGATAFHDQRRWRPSRPNLRRSLERRAGQVGQGRVHGLRQDDAGAEDARGHAGKLGVTEEQLKAMSPEERKKVEDQIKDMIKEQVMNDPKEMKKGSLLST